MTYTYTHTYTYGIHGDPSPMGVHVTTSLCGEGSDRLVSFTRTYRQKPPERTCPVCNNCHDIAYMAATPPNGHIQHICFCPNGHVWVYDGVERTHIYTFQDEPVCPICGHKLEVDTKCLMEDYGIGWSEVLKTLDEDMVPYCCPGCGEEGSLEDFRLISLPQTTDAREWRLGDDDD